MTLASHAGQRILLAIDTSTSTGSVAILCEQAGVLFQREFFAGRRHSSQLFSVLEEALAAVPARKITQIAVGLGPGSYAGVRIALSAAVGLALSHGAALVGIPSIAGLAEGDFMVIGDARRESYYLATIRAGVIVEGPDLIDTAELPERLAARDTSLPLLAAELPAAAVALYGAEVCPPSAVRLAGLVLAGRGVITADPLEPIYLREPHITAPTPGRGAL